MKGKKNSQRPGKDINTASRGIKLGNCLLRFNVPRVMGIVNNTPDSFSGDGFGGDVSQAISTGLRMFDEGADIVDVGGESTRPGAVPVSEGDEMERVIPIVRELSRLHPGRVSIDTMKPSVAEAAILAGATLVNDVSGLRSSDMIDVVSQHDVAVVIMHMKGDPRTMQVQPRYRDVVKDIATFLSNRIGDAERGGISPRKIIVDPGIGFGKTLNHNLEIISRLGEFRILGKPIAIGVSRKSFIGKLTGLPPERRLEGSLAAAVLAVREGASIVRVHDVGPTVQALKVAGAILPRCRPDGACH